MSSPGTYLRSVRIVAIAALLLGALAVPASAAPPSNDDRGDAASVGSLPFRTTLNTSEATPQDNDPECAGGPVNPTVWYSFTPSEGGRYGVSTFGSRYDTTLVVAMPNNGGLDIVDCNDDAEFGVFSTIIWQAVAGQQYLIMAGSCCNDPGGTLKLELRKNPFRHRVDVEVTIARRGIVNRSGAAVIRGRVECTRGAGVRGGLVARIAQADGRFLFRGFAETGLRCNQPWLARMKGNIGRFAPGQATARVEAFACSAFGCDQDTARRIVKLKAPD
jgi:hypothetical protein